MWYDIGDSPFPTHICLLFSFSKVESMLVLIILPKRYAHRPRISKTKFNGTCEHRHKGSCHCCVGSKAAASRKYRLAFTTESLTRKGNGRRVHFAGCIFQISDSLTSEARISIKSIALAPLQISSCRSN